MGRERYRGLPINTKAVIYIGADLRDFGICKIGMTTQRDFTNRLRQGVTSNPFYFFFKIYKLVDARISRKELRDFEKYLHRKMWDRIEIFTTSRNSEWFRIDPVEAACEVEDYIINCFDFPYEVMDFDEGGIPNSTFHEKIPLTYRYPPMKLPYDADELFVKYFIELENNDLNG